LGVDQQQNVTSKRPKYVLITFIGKGVSALRKGLILQKKGEIDNTFKVRKRFVFCFRTLIALDFLF
jgi:hypothetical protein